MWSAADPSTGESGPDGLFGEMFHFRPLICNKTCSQTSYCTSTEHHTVRFLTRQTSEGFQASRKLHTSEFQS